MEDARRNRAITKKDVALVVTFLTVFGGVLRYGEKRLDSVEAEAKQFTVITVDHTTHAIGVERNQRQEDIKLLNGKLDTIMRILLDIREK